MRFTILMACLIGFRVAISAAEWPEGVRRVTVLNYPDCFELSNADTRVTLCHQVGGRVLEYAWQGKNALYLDGAISSLWDPAKGRIDKGRIGPIIVVEHLTSEEAGSE